jgi:hypothetical protein
MADPANQAPKAKSKGFFEVGLFKRRRVTDAVRDRRMGSEFIVQAHSPRTASAFHQPLPLTPAQIMMLVIVSAVTFLSAPGAASGAVSSSIRQLFLRTSQYPHIVTGDPQNGTAFVDIAEVSQVWEWLAGPLLSAVFMDDFYSGRPFNTQPTMRAIFNSNVIVSAVTLRQKRVLPNRCHRIPVSLFVLFIWPTAASYPTPSPTTTVCAAAAG